MQSFALIPSAVTNGVFDSNFSLLRTAFVLGMRTYAVLYLSNKSVQYGGMVVTKLAFASCLTRVRRLWSFSYWCLLLPLILFIYCCCCCWYGVVGVGWGGTLDMKIG